MRGFSPEELLIQNSSDGMKLLQRNLAQQHAVTLLDRRLDASRIQP
jgi:hypothetical protein